jgi:hypothetical protein
MRLYGAIEKVEPQDDGTVRVHGIATSETVDDQDEIVRADAIRAALPDYMRFPALREMHQLSAAGTTLEAEVGDDGMTRIVAHVVDPVAVAKVKNKVYRGFSIGGRVTQRDAANSKAITGLVLNEISLVDRPANPAAVFDCWKAAVAIPGGLYCEANVDSASPAPAGSAREPFNPPVQIWTCGVPGHHHRAKSEAVKCLEMQSPGPASSSGPPLSEETSGSSPQRGQKAVEADPAIADAWREKTDSKGPPSAEVDVTTPLARMTGAPWDLGRVAQIIQELDWLRDTLELDTATPGGNSMEVVRLQTNIAELCGLLNTLVGEDIGDISGPAPIDGDGLVDAPELVAMVAGAPEVVRMVALPQTGNPNMQKRAAGLFANAKHSEGDQALVDMALYSCDKCMKLDGLSIREHDHVGSARVHLVEIGGAPMSGVSVDPAGDGSQLAAKASGSRSRAHQNLMDIAHECIGKVIGGMTCSRSDRHLARGRSSETGNAPDTGTWNSEQTMEHLHSAHRDLVAAGAQCNCGVGGAAEEHSQGDILELEKGLPATDLAKMLIDERAEKAALVRAFGEMMPMLDRLSKRIDDIACTPLPPLTIARNSVSISKQQDGGGTADIQLSPEAVASALSKMTKEDQTLTLIKASYANPIRVHGIAPGEP